MTTSTGTLRWSTSGSNYGDNQERFEAELRLILTRLAPRPTLLFTVTEYKPSYAQANESIRKLAAEFENVTLLDWEQVSKYPGVLSSDRLHPTDDGRHVLVDMVAEALGPATLGEGECLKSQLTDDSAARARRRERPRLEPLRGGSGTTATTVRPTTTIGGTPTTTVSGGGGTSGGSTTVPATTPAPTTTTATTAAPTTAAPDDRRSDDGRADDGRSDRARRRQPPDRRPPAGRWSSASVRRRLTFASRSIVRLPRDARQVDVSGQPVAWTGCSRPKRSRWKWGDDSSSTPPASR